MNHNISSILFTSSAFLVLATTPVITMTGVSAEPALPDTSTPILPKSTSPQDNATSPQIKPGISPDQPTASKIRYECKNEGDKLSTVAHTNRGMIELIVWESNYFGSKWSPVKRCEAVSERFQLFSNQRLLRFVSTGKLNNYNVICISEKAGNCIDQGLLLTLEHKDQPTHVLRTLFNYRASIRRGPRKKEVIDFERLLNERTPIATPEAPIGGAAETPSNVNTLSNP